MTLAGTALAFARHGHLVFPVWWPIRREGRLFCACGKSDCLSPAKHPLAQIDAPRGPRIAPNGVLSATTDADIVKHWWSLAPEANIGVSTVNLVALDIDVRHYGLTSLAALEREHGKMPPTWTVVTGSGGLHYYYRRPEGLELSLPIIAGNIGRKGGTPPLGGGIDVPAYLVAPPSGHISGGFYQWEVDGHPSDVPLADAPSWLVERLTRPVNGAAERTARSAVDWEIVARRIVTEYRDAEVTRVAGKLLRAVSLPATFARELTIAWNACHCRPPLPEEEVLRIFDRIARREVQRLECEIGITDG